MAPLYARSIRPLVVDALSDTRVVFVAGARQVGKTTLTVDITSSDHPMTRFTLDDDVTRAAALDDPSGFVAGLPGPALIDEVQRAPDVLLAIKDAVDSDKTPGRFLVTGSANILTSKKIKDALTGRMETIRLWPLSQAEINGSTTNFIDALFAGELPQINGATVGRDAFSEIVVAGGYPEAHERSARRRGPWFSNYIETTLESDLRDITDAVKLEEMPRLLRLLATQAAGLISYRNLGQRLDLHHDTVKAYVGLLEQMFLVVRLKAWRPGLGAREVTAPKIYIADSGMLAFMLGANPKRVADDDQVTGKIFENFVTMEVLRHQPWASEPANIFHYQRDKEDVDLVIERYDGTVVAIEAKAKASLGTKDYRWITKMRNELGDRFRAGVVIHSGGQTVPLGERLWAMPVSGLWT